MAETTVIASSSPLPDPVILGTGCVGYNRYLSVVVLQQPRVPFFYHEDSG